MTSFKIQKSMTFCSVKEANKWSMCVWDFGTWGHAVFNVNLIVFRVRDYRVSRVIPSWAGKHSFWLVERESDRLLIGCFLLLEELGGSWMAVKYLVLSVSIAGLPPQNSWADLFASQQGRQRERETVPCGYGDLTTPLFLLDRQFSLTSSPINCWLLVWCGSGQSQPCLPWISY